MRWRWATKDPTHTLRVDGRVIRRGEVFDLDGPRPHEFCELVEPPVEIEPEPIPEPPKPKRRRRRRVVED